MSTVFGSSLGFGANNNTTSNTNTGASLFQPASGTQTGQSLFSNLNSQPTNTNTSTIFGNNNAQPANNNTSSMFGNPNTTAGATTGQSLFGQPQQQQQQSFGGFNQPQQQAQQPSLFAAQAPFQNSQWQQQPQPQQQQSFNASQQFPQPQQQDFALSQLRAHGHPDPARADSKPILDAAGTLLRKWDPQSQDSLLQTYLYNAVAPTYAPFFSRNPGEDEKAWEEALSNAPPPIEASSEAGAGVKFVPVLVRGFWDLGQRVEYQAHTVKAMMERLHEMKNSLEAVMAAHGQRITAALEASRRRHAMLAQRTLRLSVKLQVLRNRGYALDTQEEALRKSLLTLSAKVSDPQFAAREEEVWARMVALRERGRWLEEEGKRLGSQVQEQAVEGSGVPENVVVATRKILRDYDVQLRHLGKELEAVRGELGGWEAGQKG
ncbi:Nucleoporin nup57 [Teratosphaeriaceae sp. CCFEE 6253]|nr:Nucleoporin nup57 [Teratosphaeriaceae sp. CCFEE 6253]